MKIETTAAGKLLHILTIATLLIAFLQWSGSDAQNAIQQATLGIWTVQYIAVATFFEVVALHCKEVKDDTEH